MRILPLLLAAPFLSGAAIAQTSDLFFNDRQLTMLIGGGSGGSVDLYARIIARQRGRGTSVHDLGDDSST
jgi:tripartite-type tricarboxylate transporter receptor subunit TctC